MTSCGFNSAIDAEGNVTIRESSPLMRSHGTRTFQHLKRTQKISHDPKYIQRVDRVASRIFKAINLPKSEWEFVIFKDHSPNAFCLPGGKVGINTGLFRVTGDNDALLAAVLGHEISHATANHAEQRMHHALGMLIGGALIWHVLDNNNSDHNAEAVAAFVASTYLIDSLPLSRRQEYESDKMSAIFMAKAGYDPRKAVVLWKLMSSSHFRKKVKTPTFLRTHPHNEDRIRALENFMPIAMRHYQQSKKSHTHQNR